MEAAGLLRAVLPFAADETARVRLQASLTRALALAGDSEAARVLGEDALASARLLDDSYARRLAFDAMSFVPWTPQRLERQLADMREAAETARDVGDLEWENHAVCKTLYGEILAGDLTAARLTAARHHRLAVRLGQPLFRVLDCQAHALLAVGEGRFRDAEVLAAEADELSRALSEDPSGGYGVQLFSIRREQGRLDEARPIVEAIARLGRVGSTWRPALAVMYAELGLHDEAAAVIDVLHADRLAAVPRDALWHGSLSYLADACAAVGHRDGAAAVYEELIGWRGLVVQVGHLLAANGAVDRYLGKLAALLGHDREAEIHFETALRIESAAGMPVWLAHSQLDYGRTMVARGQPRGEGLLRAALTTAEQLGMATVAAAARSELGEQPKEPTGALLAGLTEREVAVLALVADGRSNREIGAQPAHQPAHRGEPRALDPDEAAVRQPHRGGGVGVAAEPGDRHSASGEQFLRPQLIDADDDVGGEVVAPRRLDDRLLAVGLVQAVRLALVGAEERVDPAHAGVVVDGDDTCHGVAVQIQGFGELALDQEEGHGSTLRLGVSERVR